MGLVFDKNAYETKCLELDGKQLKFKAYEGIIYVEHPVAPEVQVLNIYIPEQSPYKEGEMPIFMPNTVGGYMPGPAATPRIWENGEGNSVVQALLRGYMVAAPGLRGRGMKNEKGENIGVAPAGICDYKAAVRYLRYNKKLLPGNTEKIISNGTSAGGALARQEIIRITSRTWRKWELQKNGMIFSTHPAIAPLLIWSMRIWPMNGNLAVSRTAIRVSIFRRNIPVRKENGFLWCVR